MKKAVIGGNHIITSNLITFEEKPLKHSFQLLDESTDLILFFDQAGVETFSFVDSYKNLPLVKMENFFRGNELPSLPDNTRLIFENTLRNYSRRTLKLGRDSALKQSMLSDHDDHIKCSCVGIVISLIEILFKNYESVTFVADKQSMRLRISDLLKAKIAIPALEIVWV